MAAVNGVVNRVPFPLNAIYRVTSNVTRQRTCMRIENPNQMNHGNIARPARRRTDQLLQQAERYSAINYFGILEKREAAAGSRRRGALADEGFVYHSSGSGGSSRPASAKTSLRREELLQALGTRNVASVGEHGITGALLLDLRCVAPTSSYDRRSDTRRPRSSPSSAKNYFGQARGRGGGGEPSPASRFVYNSSRPSRRPVSANRRGVYIGDNNINDCEATMIQRIGPTQRNGGIIVAIQYYERQRLGTCRGGKRFRCGAAALRYRWCLPSRNARYLVRTCVLRAEGLPRVRAYIMVAGRRRKRRDAALLSAIYMQSVRVREHVLSYCMCPCLLKTYLRLTQQ
ncbi:uncharacterized protein LOC143896339 [Temnothorax americanus]|uniref:uncharacterized protein LOC143896339 n=1 Tax=Temnothorax americanus TaxID=1964332 RepID=UPI004067F650